MIDLSIIIVNYNTDELVNQCISSIKATTSNIKYEIIVVDNASPDDNSDNILQGDLVRLIKLKKNIGFSGGNNVALKESLGEYVLLLNPDTIVHEKTINDTLNFYRSKENIGAVGCKLLNQNGKLDPGCKRSFPTAVSSISHFSKLDKIFPKSKTFGKYNLTYIDENEVSEVECISGAFMMIKKSVLDKVGFLDERFFMHSEDIDLCFRIKEAGYKIFYYPKVDILHLKGQSGKKSSEEVMKYLHNSMWLFYEKHYSKKNGPVFNKLVKLGISLKYNLSKAKNKLK